MVKVKGEFQEERKRQCPPLQRVQEKSFLKGSVVFENYEISDLY